MHKLLTLSFLLLSAPGMASVIDESYDRLKELYNRPDAVALNPANLPNVTILEGREAGADTPEDLQVRFIFWKTEIEGKTPEARFAKIRNEIISNAEAAAHAQACKQFVPQATIFEGGKALVQWNTYNRYRYYSPSFGSAVMQHLYSVREVLDETTGKKTIVARLDYRESWALDRSTGHYVYVGEVVRIGDKYLKLNMVDVVPAEPAELFCNKLISPWYYINFPQ